MASRKNRNSVFGLTVIALALGVLFVMTGQTGFGIILLVLAAVGVVAIVLELGLWRIGRP